ncbi:sugar phosphate isomerase/epimerase [bacterium]|nr:sugar phosphate isomerase/epimerase [bacterium]
MKSSLSSYLFSNYSLEDAVKQTAEAGFDAIDIWGGRPHAYRDDLHEHEIRRIRRLLDDLGMEVTSFIPALTHSYINLCHPKKAVRSDGIAYLITCVETAARLGAPIISVLPNHTLHGQDMDEAWDLLGDSLIRICEFASHYNVLIAIEPADAFESDLINTSIQALDMIEQIGCENLGVLFDTGHALLAGEDTSTAICHLGDQLLHVHLSDNHGERDEHLVPGQGIFDFKALIRALRLTLYEGSLMAEPGWDYTLDPEPAAIACQDFMQNLIDT